MKNLTARQTSSVGGGRRQRQTTTYQLGLWDTDTEPDHRLQATLDELRDRFGNRAIQRGSQLKREDTVDF